MPKKDELLCILAKYGVSLCYISCGFDFDAEAPDGSILVDIDSDDLIQEIYRLFTVENDGVVLDSQTLWVADSTYEDIMALSKDGGTL